MKCFNCEGELLLVREKLVLDFEKDVIESVYTCENYNCDTKAFVYREDKDDKEDEL